jgi:ketosteroid isomerase-like protein
MSKRFALALLAVGFFGVVAGHNRPALASDAAAEKAVLAAQDMWKQAVIKKDRAAFDKVLHPDLRYGHSDGHIEDKATAIKMIVDGAAVWEAVNFADTTVRVNGNTAFVTGKVQYVERENGQLAEVNLVVLSAWVKEPKGWQMIARQSTRPTPAKILQAAPAVKK